MIPASPQWPGFPHPFAVRASRGAGHLPSVGTEAPDHHSQLEDLLGHVRRCERWARIDDQIDLHWRLEGKG